ncbi:MAG: ketoacyl-ACP synthase III [Bergeyella sp.]|nr:ketoacyl-ACP synthase III [Bergeyella sp.]
MSLNSVIIGSGCYIPKKIVSGKDFLTSEFYDENHQKIEKPNEEVINKFIEITEIKERRYIEENELNSDMGTRAAKKAMEEAKINPESLDYIICATNMGEIDIYGNRSFMPSVSAIIKHKLGIRNLKCIPYDMIFGCPGWVEAFILANTLIKSRKGKNILVIGSDTLSRAIDPYDRDKMIFADGAGAVILQATEEKHVGVIAENTLCFTGEEICYLEHSYTLNPHSESKNKYIRMKGRKIYEFALKNVPIAIKDTMDKAGLGIRDIDKILIHQANAKMDYAIISRLFKLYGIETYDHAISPMTIQRLGNSSVATLPTMYDLIKKGKFEGQNFKKGSYIVFTSVGAGMNINAIVYKFPKEKGEG